MAKRSDHSGGTALKTRPRAGRIVLWAVLAALLLGAVIGVVSLLGRPSGTETPENTAAPTAVPDTSGTPSETPLPEELREAPLSPEAEIAASAAVRSNGFPMLAWAPDGFSADSRGRMQYSGGKYLTGIDVSEHQYDIDWEKVAADGIDFAMIRVGYRGSTAGQIYTDEYFEKNIAGAKSTLDENIKLFADYSKVERVLRRPSSADEPYLAPSDLESSHIFLVVPDKKQEFYSLFCNIVVTQMLDYIGQRPYDRSRDKRILLALDEFASLRHLEILGPMRKFRKNGANICILTQSLADIDLEYSRDERKVILDNCTYTVVLSGNDPETRTYFSDLVGKEDHRKISTTTGSRTDSTSTSLQEGYAIHPNTWKSLGEQLVVIHRTGYLKLRKNFYFKG